MLRAARAVFAEKGYAQATLDEIAARAEFGKGTLYNYFEGGKEDILFAVFEEIHDGILGLVQRFAVHAEDAPLRDAFQRFVREVFDFFMEREGLFMMLVKEGHQFDFEENQERVAYFHEQESRLVNAMQSVLERAIAEGEIRALPTRPVAHLMLENTKGILKARTMMAYRPAGGPACEDTLLDRPDDAAGLLATILFDGLRTDEA